MSENQGKASQFTELEKKMLVDGGWQCSFCKSVYEKSIENCDFCGHSRQESDLHRLGLYAEADGGSADAPVQAVPSATPETVDASEAETTPEPEMANVPQEEQTQPSPQNKFIYADTDLGEQEQAVIDDGGWQCGFCRRINAYIVTSCACGHNRDDSDLKHLGKYVDPEEEYEYEDYDADEYEEEFDEGEYEVSEEPQPALAEPPMTKAAPSQMVTPQAAPTPQPVPEAQAAPAFQSVPQQTAVPLQPSVAQAVPQPSMAAQTATPQPIPQQPVAPKQAQPGTVPQQAPQSVPQPQPAVQAVPQAAPQPMPRTVPVPQQAPQAVPQQPIAQPVPPQQPVSHAIPQAALETIPQAIPTPAPEMAAPVLQQPAGGVSQDDAARKENLERQIMEDLRKNSFSDVAIVRANRKYKEMVKRGIMTQEEFNQKIHELLPMEEEEKPEEGENPETQTDSE